MTLRQWTRPQHYIGPDWPEHYVFLGKHRDSDRVDRSNFDVAIRELGGESETVEIVRDSHWAVGWVEWIAIHESNAVALEKARSMDARIANYPILDEHHYSELEFTESMDWWRVMGLAERVRLCQEHGISVFAARRADEVPQDDNGALWEDLSREC